MIVSEDRPCSPAEGEAGASVQVLFFGKVADVFGRSASVDIPACGCPLAEVRARLAGIVDGGAAALTERGVRAAVDQQVASEDVWVRPGQEVAIFSMFSGG